MKASKEKSIRCIGTYFLVLGFICALQIPMFFEISDKGSIVYEFVSF